MRPRRLKHILITLMCGSLLLLSSCSGCNSNPTTELSTSDIEAPLEDTTDAGDTESYSLAVDEIEVTENEDGSVTVTVKDKNGMQETVTYEDKAAYDEAVKESAAPSEGDVITVTSSSNETKVEVTKKSEDGSKTTVAVIESTKNNDNTTAASSSKEAEAKTTGSEAGTESTAGNKTSSEESKTTAPSTTATPSTAAPSTAANDSSTTAAAHTHNWVEVTKTVHHEAETKTVHHDAETKVVHHEAVYSTVTVPEQGHWEETTTKVEVEPAWDELIQEQHEFCNTCGVDLIALWRQAGAPGDVNDFIWDHLDEYDHTGFHSDMATVQVIHHDAIYEDQITKTWVVDVPAHDEQKLVSEARDETVVVKPAWDETVVTKAAWDETIVTGQKCSICGATK